MQTTVKLMIVSALATAGLMGVSVPALATETAAAPMLLAQASDADKEFAAKLRELKKRQNDEWNDLVDEHEAAIKGASSLTSEEKATLAKQQMAEKKAMQKRHDEELEALKAEYPA